MSQVQIEHQYLHPRLMEYTKQSYYSICLLSSFSIELFLTSGYIEFHGCDHLVLYLNCQENHQMYVFHHVSYFLGIKYQLCICFYSCIVKFYSLKHLCFSPWWNWKIEPTMHLFCFYYMFLYDDGVEYF